MVKIKTSGVLMKKIFILLFLVLISLLNASFLIDVYHKDYGVINRTVLVFDTKPQYEILKHESDIQINLQNCSKDISLQKLDIENSKVITGLNYLVSEDKVMVMININTTQLLITGEIFKVEGMELQGDVFKLVLDIFISTNPKTLSELTSYASFYETTGNMELADKYNKLVVELHDKTKDQQENVTVRSTQDVTKKEQLKITDKFKSSIKNLSTKFDYKLIGVAFGIIILLVIIIILIIKLARKKSSAFDLDKNSLRPTDGFADSAYLEKVAIELASKNWGLEEIAKELELPLHEIQRIIAPDIEQELERL